MGVFFCFMACFHPTVIKNPAYCGIYFNGEPRLIRVPCGKCFGCMLSRRNVWLFRLLQESLHSDVTYFVTLTFSPEHLHQLDKRDLQLLFKRMRKSGCVFRYYAIGEYGSSTGREHYHACFFLKESSRYKEYSEFCSLIDILWPDITDVSIAFPARLSYILHYHIRPKDYEGKEVPTFQLFSKGLGIDFLTPELAAELVTHNDYVIRDAVGRTMSLPRYYRVKFDLPKKDNPFIKQQKSFLQIAHEEGRDDEFDLLRDIDELSLELIEKYNKKQVL